VRVTQKAMVLGSRQDESLLNGELCSRDGSEVVRRRSGSGESAGDCRHFRVITAPVVKVFFREFGQFGLEFPYSPMK
jgi:hypothetical protein